MKKKITYLHDTRMWVVRKAIAAYRKAFDKAMTVMEAEVYDLEDLAESRSGVGNALDQLDALAVIAERRNNAIHAEPWLRQQFIEAAGHVLYWAMEVLLAVKAWELDKEALDLIEPTAELRLAWISVMMEPLD